MVRHGAANMLELIEIVLAFGIKALEQAQFHLGCRLFLIRQLA